MGVCLSALGAAKTKRGHNTRCKSFSSAMIGACTKWAALMNQLENISNFGTVGNLISDLITLVRQGYETHNPFSENGYWLVIEDSKKKTFVQIYNTFSTYYLLSHNPNILEKLNLVLTLSLIHPFLALFEDYWPCFDTSWSVTLLLATAEAPPAWSPANTPLVLHVETTWKFPFPRRFNVEYKWCVCR